MKAKFLIPEIDKKRFAENLSEEMRISKLELKSLTEIGIEEVSTASIWQYREGIKFWCVCFSEGYVFPVLVDYNKECCILF